MTIRLAAEDDLEGILGLIRDLASYEREPDVVETSVADLRAALLGPDATARCHVAEVDGEVVGMALWFPSFSTWTGKTGIWLEDLYVRPEHRGSGLGRQLLAALAAVCIERGYARLEWWVLDWNEPAIGFYRSLGAEPMEEFTTYRMSGEALANLGSN